MSKKNKRTGIKYWSTTWLGLKQDFPTELTNRSSVHDWSVITFGDTSLEFHTLGFVEKIRSRVAGILNQTFD